MAQGVQIGRGYIAVTVDESGARAALRGFVGFAGTAFKTATVAAGTLIAAAAKVGVSFNSMQEQASIAFSTLLGDGAKAQQFLLELQQFSAKTPFELPGLINNARQLLGVGIAADKVIPTLESLGNAAGALGIDQERFNNILLATTQAFGKGKLQGEELMQMVENGIPVWQLLSKATGKSVEELQKLSSEGKLLAADTLPLLFDQMNKDYGGAMAAQSKTLSGSWSSLKDNTQILLGTAFKPLFNETKGLVGALGELASSDAATAWSQRFASGLERGIDAVRIFAKNVDQRFGDDVQRALDGLKKRFGDLWPEIKRGAENAGTILLSFFEKVLPALIDLAHAGSGLLRPAIDAVNTVLEALADNADQIASGVVTLANTVAAVAAPAFQILGGVLKVAADLMSLLVNLVGDLNGPLGVLAGTVLVSVTAWRTLAGVLGGIGALWGKISPAGMAERLAPVSKRIGEISERAGVMAWQLTGSAAAGHKVVTAGRSIGSILTKVGSALPVVGLAAVGVGMAFEAVAAQSERVRQKQEEMADALLRGGAAAAKVKQDLERMTDVAERAAKSSDTGWFATALQGTADNVNRIYQDQLNNMSNVERAQTLMAQAQRDYDHAVREHGSGSEEAAGKLAILRARTEDVGRAQQDAANATRSHEQSIWDLANAALAAANADVALRQAELDVTEAQMAYTQAVQQHGAASTQAQQASLSLEQAYIRAAQAAAQKALADNAGASESTQAAAAQKAYTDKLIEMAYAAGTNAPPALLKMLAGLDSATLAAINAAAETSGFKTAVLTLPDGRLVKIAVDDAGRPVLDAFKVQWDALKSKTITLDVVRHQRSPDGGFAPGLATGGPLQANVTTLVGEEGPELITRTRGGWVHTAEETAKKLGIAAAGTSSDSRPVVQNNHFPPSLDAEQVVNVAMTRLAWVR